MRFRLSLLVALLACQSISAITPTKRNHYTHDYYVLEHLPGAGASIHECVKALGVELVEQVGELRDHWVVRIDKQSLPTREESSATDLVLSRFEGLRTRAKEQLLSHRSTDAPGAREIVSSVKYLSRQTLKQRTKRDDNLLDRAPPPIIAPAEELGVNATAHAVALRLGFNDPMFTKQWHLVNDEYPQHMMNATPIWEMGLTGKGIITALVDDGLDYRSDDIAANFDAAGSYDFNDHVDLPTPVLFDDHHGTRCGGQIAAVKNNVCGVGIAYDSKVAGIRILSGPITDIDEAASLNYGYQNTSIYSCSWGPPDDGRSMERPSYLIAKAMVNGVQNGRAGKGAIYVFASGNGNVHGDQCNFDGYTNSIFSVTVAAVDYKGLHPYYSESCAANMVVAYSSGDGRNIVTTDVGKDKCATTHGGTSAAAPNAAGVIALALGARPDLTWRDIQHLCVRNAQLVSPEDPDWETTAAGRPFSYKYGYGKIDAYHYVTAAQTWKNVKPQAWIEMEAIQLGGGVSNALGEMSGGELIVAGGIKSSMTLTKARIYSENFESLEHVTVTVWISHGRRGDVEVEIVSPAGIKSILAATRKSDTDTDGFPGWKFMSVKHWDENPVGEWTIKVSDQQNENNGSFLGWTMTFWGSTADASNVKTYNLPLDNATFPPLAIEHPIPTATIEVPGNTKTHPKPTAGLPDDHGDKEGEAHEPAFPGHDDAAAPSMTGTPDNSWFPGMGKLVSDQKWFFIAAGAVVLFGITAGVFFWRRRMTQRRRANYSTLAADDLAMSSVSRDRTGGGGGRTKELYDAFGEVSDDEDEDADEETGLARRGPVSPGGRLGFHSGFLDDDDTQNAGPASVYKDEPEHSRRHGGLDSPASQGTGDGSWEHASDP